MGISLKGRNGEVVETWEKCEVDPTCCCAEQVDLGMAVRVRFQGSIENTDVTEGFFDHYFAEEELFKVAQKQQSATSESAAFDGLSCTAFKMNHLASAGQKPRGQFSYDPNQS